MLPHRADEIKIYLSVFGSYRGRNAALHWYRANRLSLDGVTSGIKFGKASHPTLFLWGSKDPAICRPAAEASSKHMTGEYRFVELNTGH